MKEAVAGFDDAGNMTVYELEPGERLPPGVHSKPPPGTHPHERDLAKLAENAKPVEAVIMTPPAPPPALFSVPVEQPPPSTKSPDTIANLTGQTIVSKSHLGTFDIPHGRSRRK